jgi:hypothetical protein
VVALLLATAVDAALWAVRRGDADVRAGSASPAGRGHVTSSLLTSADANALLVGAGHQAAYFIFWSIRNGKLQGQISQYLIEPPWLPDQKAPGTDVTGDSFTGTVAGSRVKMSLAGNGLNGVTLMTGRIRSGHLLSLSDLFNRMYYGDYNRLNQRDP